MKLNLYFFFQMVHSPFGINKSVCALYKQLKSRVFRSVFVSTTAGDDDDNGDGDENPDGDGILPIDGRKNRGRQFTDDVKTNS